jgi:hypothetical protein
MPADARTGRGEMGAVDLFWLPLGAGGHSVRLNGRVYEGLSALRQHRRARHLYHSALQVNVPEGGFVIEMTPVRRPHPQREIVADGAVGAAWAAGWKIGRYEVCCWRDGTIPDVAEAVDSPRHMTADASSARRLLEFLPALPTPVWGRDELETGEMWNSNSVTAWLLAVSGIAERVHPPAGGSAPGWAAGLAVAQRAGTTDRRDPRNPRGRHGTPARTPVTSPTPLPAVARP